MAVVLEKFSLERVASAVAKVQTRLSKATGALARSNVPYAVVGDAAVAVWVHGWIRLRFEILAM